MVSGSLIGVHLPDPRIALGDTRGIIGELAREIGIEKVGISRPGAVMEQAADHLDAALVEHREPLVGPARSRSRSGRSGATLSHRIG